MALTTNKVDSGGLGIKAAVSNSSIRADWKTLHSDAEASNVAIGSPLNITQAGARWTRVPPNATRLFLRGRSTAGGTLTTSPTVAIALFHADSFGGDLSPLQSEGGTSVPHTGIACNLTKVHDDADGTNSADWDFGAVQDNGGEGYDLLGASWVLILVTTSASTTSASSEIQGLFLN